MRIDLLPASREDLREIWRFGVQNLSLPLADRYLDELDAAIKSLVDNPRRAAPAIGLGRSFRRLIVGSHAVFYQLLDDKIEIVRILHQSAKAKTRVAR